MPRLEQLSRADGRGGGGASPCARPPSAVREEARRETEGQDAERGRSGKYAVRDPRFAEWDSVAGGIACLLDAVFLVFSKILASQIYLESRLEML